MTDTELAVYVHKVCITDIEKGQEEELKGLDLAGKLELKQQFVQLRARGWSLRKIAKRLRVSRSTLSDWQAELEEEIASLRAIELEALFEQYYISKEARIRLLGEQLKRVRLELNKRDLTDVPTDTLMAMLLKLAEALEEEHTEARPLTQQEILALKGLRSS
jgi:transposase